MSINEKAAGTVAKLLHLTLKGELEWKPVRDTTPLTYGTEDLADVAYTAEYSDNVFALYKARFKGSNDGDTFYWTDRVVLKLVDREGRTQWEFPTVAPLDALYKKVQMQAECVEDRLDRILAA